jgi:Lhr-like helicase
MHALKQYVVIDDTESKHRRHPAQDPVHLLQVRPGELAVLRCAMDLHHPQPADEQDEEEQHPVKISK